MKLFLFTYSFPYGFSEPFLENEIGFLAERFEKIVIVPLCKIGEQREIPQNVEIQDSIIKFTPKDRKKMLVNGIFNFSPFRFAIKEFFSKKVYKNRKHLWNFFTSLLLLRAMSANKNLFKFLKKEVELDDKLYFYWGDKSANLIPKIKKQLPENQNFVRFHGTDLYEYANAGYIPFRNYLFAKIDNFIPISQDGKNYLLNNYKNIISQNKISVQRLGVKDRGQNPEKQINEKFYILSCSWVVKVKRIDLIINALQNISFPVKWTHIGSGALFDEMKKLCENLPANIEVNFTGAMTNAEVMRYFTENHIDIFINVSKSEGVPVSIMESLSFGVPVIATDVGGTAEIVDNQVGKLLNANVTGEEIAAAINDFFQSDLKEFRKNARTQWAQRCNSDKNYKEFAQYLKEN